jgi:hypothetical protein
MNRRRAGPGRPFASSLSWAAWRCYLTPEELTRTRQIEDDLIRSERAGRRERCEAQKYEYQTIRNRAVKRSSAEKRAG